VVDRNLESSASQAQSEAPSVAAPTPVVPQWGGSSQLFFGNHGSSSAISTPDNPNPRGEDVTGTESRIADSTDSDDDDDDDDEDESDASSGKGKAKAVTVEDVKEDESD
jgi:E3 ubiquitin-protein ligase synoviolin